MARTYESPIAALQDQLKVEKILRTEIIPAAQTESAMRTMRKVSAASPVDRGYYKNAWTVVSDIVTKLVQLINDAPYAGVLEQGARPFWAPIKPLLEWAQRKAGALALGGKIKLSSTAFSLSKAGNLRYKGPASLDENDHEEVERFAYALQRKIAREGLPAHWIMRKHLPFATRMLDLAMKRKIRELERSKGLR